MIPNDDRWDGLRGVPHEHVRSGRELIGNRFHSDAERLPEKILLPRFILQWVDPGNREREGDDTLPPGEAATIGEDDGKVRC